MIEQCPPACGEDGLPEPIPFSAERIAEVAKALAHPARIRIVEQFAEAKPHMTQDIVDGCTLAQSTVSEHLRILRDAGILVATRDGPRTWHCLRRSVLHGFAAAVEEMTRRRALTEAG